jgi:hypothetical protein
MFLQLSYSDTVIHSYLSISAMSTTCGSQLFNGVATDGAIVRLKHDSH